MLKGLSVGGPSSHLVPYQYIFSIDDLDGMFTVKAFVEHYDQMVEAGTDTAAYQDLTNTLEDFLRPREKNEEEKEVAGTGGTLVEQILILNNRHGKDNKPAVKRSLFRTAAYKDYVKFVQLQWGVEQPLFFKTYPDLISHHRFSFQIGSWSHALRNFFQ